MRYLLAITFALALPLMAIGQLVSGPSAVGNGEAIHYQYGDYKPGDVIQWTVLNPFPEPAVVQIQTAFGTDLIIDPPINWRGIVRVQCFVMDSDRRVKHFETTQTAVEWTDEEPDPGPGPDPEPVDPPANYDGPNRLGIGKVSFDSVPGTSDRAVVVDIAKRAAEYLYGRPNLKVIYTQDPARNNSEFNLLYWFRSEMQSKHPDWDDWYNAVMQQMKDAGLHTGSPIALWYEAFLEAAAGVEARQ